mgnify:CR=1 FL=1
MSCRCSESVLSNKGNRGGNCSYGCFYVFLLNSEFWNLCLPLLWTEWTEIKKGEIISENNIRSIRPGYGLLPKYMDEIIGKKAMCDISYGTALTRDMISG